MKQRKDISNSVPPVGKLDTILRVRREMAKLYKEARQGKLETQEATRFCFILKSNAQLIESSDLEQRIEVLEEICRTNSPRKGYERSMGQ